MKPEIQVNKKFWSVRVRNRKMVVLRECGYFHIVQLGVRTNFEQSPQYRHALVEWFKFVGSEPIPTSIYMTDRETRSGIFGDIHMIRGRYYNPFFIQYYISWIYCDFY